jgi:hypothetical protein
MKDSSGKLNCMPDLIEKHVMDFYRLSSADDRSNMRRYKFALYEHPPGIKNPLPHYLAGDSGQLRVIHFDANSLVLRTDLGSGKFLVYNDAYSIFWKASINGKEIKIHLTNHAFKGIDVPPGKNIIRFDYCPYGGTWTYMVVMAAMFFSGIYLIFLLCQPLRASLK